MTYQITEIPVCDEQCCVAGLDEELPRWSAGNHVRPMFEVLFIDSYPGQEHVNLAEESGDYYWNEPADSSWYGLPCMAIRDTDGNVVFPELVDPTDQHCPYPGDNPPPPPPQKHEREFAIAA